MGSLWETGPSTPSMMVDLAKEAFNTQNFQLAVEIYERTIKENGPSFELCLGLANSFAFCGHFEKAFDTYASAFRLGNLTPSSLKHLVSALVNAVKQDNIATSPNMSKSCMFTCTICRGLFNEPVTISCGHTYCRKCFERDQSKACRTCGTLHHLVKTSNFKANVLLTRLIESWFPNENKASCLKAEGNKFFERRQYDKSIELYSIAIELCKYSFFVNYWVMKQESGRRCFVTSPLPVRIKRVRSTFTLLKLCN